ncbi:MAG: HAD-IA family hydrolase, partial [Spirochaetota bacterium]
NQTFRKLVETEGADIYDSTISLVKDLKKRGIKVGVASSSQNCRFILEKTGLLKLFDAVIGGEVSKELGLRGKPYPDIFVVAAENLGLHPNECMMVEDAIAGVEAGKNGNFAMVVGVARNGDEQALMAQGADITIKDMGELSYQNIQKWFEQGIIEDSWRLTYYGFEPDSEKLRETLTTVGNGYFGTRGCFEGERADEVVHYPGTYIAGVYNRLPSVVYRKTIYNNDLVNCPNWLLIEVKIGDSDYMHLMDMEILSYRHTLNMKDGVMSRALAAKDQQGRITEIESYRMACMHNPHYGAVKYRITPQNYSEKLTFRSTLDGTVINYGVARYRELNSKHLAPISVGRQNGEIYLHVETTTRNTVIFMSAKNTLYHQDIPLNVNKKISRHSGIISEEFTVDARKGHTYTLQKLVSIYTSNDRDTDDPEGASGTALARAGTFEKMLGEHKKAWHMLWEKADFHIEGDRFSQRTTRLHIFHLLATASIHNKMIDAGMPARGLHGEAYRGHIFWDEIYIFPFYNLHFPEIAKALLMYRYRRLDAAREYARENGYQGAMFPWQSANTGDEETQVIHFNPLSGRWDPDLSRLQRHVSIAIAYNVWEYFYCTNDLEFLHNYGAEIMIKIARFWSSIAQYDENDSRYHISNVMGPDEFHEKYPDSEEGGLKDNAYTNIMVCWLMHKTIETVEHLPGNTIKEISEKTGFQLDEILRWRDIVEHMNVEITEEGVLCQFAGYMELQELDFDRYREKYGNIRRMDRILKAEGDSPDRYKVSKQADVLMLFYLLSPGQVKHILEIMGYRIGDELEFMEKNYEFYEKRTTHGSTLSYIVHSAILKYLKTHKIHMWERFLKALESDIYDTQGGTTTEGIHCGVMGGTIDTIMKGFAGINLFKDYILLDPSLPG